MTSPRPFINYHFVFNNKLYNKEELLLNVFKISLLVHLSIFF